MNFESFLAVGAKFFHFDTDRVHNSRKLLNEASLIRNHSHLQFKVNVVKALRDAKTLLLFEKYGYLFQMGCFWMDRI